MNENEVFTKIVQLPTSRSGPSVVATLVKILLLESAKLSRDFIYLWLKKFKIDLDSLFNATQRGTVADSFSVADQKNLLELLQVKKHKVQFNKALNKKQTKHKR